MAIEQRLTETDEEFAARKKRIAAHRRGGNDLANTLRHGGGSNPTPAPPGELVINGTFKAGALGWFQMQVVTGGHGSTDGGEGWQIIQTEVGVTYQFTCDYDRQGVNPSISIKDKTETGSSLLVFNPIADGWNNVAGQFTALSVESVVHFGNGSDTALFDNVSVKEVV